MHDLCPTSHQTTNAIGCHDDHTEGQEHQQMDIGEEVDELTDGVVRGHFRQQLVLMNPAKGELVTSHLHPDRIDSVGRYRHDVGHNDALALKE